MEERRNKWELRGITKWQWISFSISISFLSISGPTSDAWHTRGKACVMTLLVMSGFGFPPCKSLFTLISHPTFHGSH